MLAVLDILIVEDNEDDQHLYRRSLRGSGYRLTIVPTAAEALARLAETQPNILLLDYNLPDLNGLEFMEELSERDDVAIPIVMLTGEGNEAIAVEAMKAGASDYLVKDTAGRYLRLLPSVVSRVHASHQEKMHARRLEALHDAILGTVADGILGINSSGKILFANPAAGRMLLCPAEQLIGRPLKEFLRSGTPEEEWSTHPLSEPHDGSVTLCRESDLFQRVGSTSFPVAYTASPLDFEGSGHFGWVLVFQDITERKQAEEELIQTARYDTLTGLPNRVMFGDYFAKALSRAERNGRHVALMFIDLDGFKGVNDTLGHLAGDRLLQLVAQRLVKCVRAGDLVSRLGGDEFTMIVEDSRPDQIAALAQKIVRVLEAPYELAPYELGEQEAHISASIGIALYPECGSDAHTLTQQADAAMYRVKKAGKKGYAFCCRVEAEWVNHNPALELEYTID